MVGFLCSLQAVLLLLPPGQGPGTGGGFGGEERPRVWSSSRSRLLPGWEATGEGSGAGFEIRRFCARAARVPRGRYEPHAAAAGKRSREKPAPALPAAERSPGGLQRWSGFGSARLSSPSSPTPPPRNAAAGSGVWYSARSAALQLQPAATWELRVVQTAHTAAGVKYGARYRARRRRRKGNVHNITFFVLFYFPGLQRRLSGAKAEAFARDARA